MRIANPHQRLHKSSVEIETDVSILYEQVRNQPFMYADTTRVQLRMDRLGPAAIIAGTPLVTAVTLTALKRTTGTICTVESIFHKYALTLVLSI